MSVTRYLPEGVHRQLDPLEFVETRWVEHRVTDHSGSPVAALMKEYGVYRYGSPERRWAYETGLCKLILDGVCFAGNRAFCLAKLDDHRRMNPRGYSDDTLSIINEFFRTRGGQGWQDGHSAVESGPCATASRSTPPSPAAPTPTSRTT